MAAWSAWAPPVGSGTMRSATPSSSRSGAVSLRASAASGAWRLSFHTIDAAASGVATEKTLCSSISRRSATPMASEPPLPPSPITEAMIGHAQLGQGGDVVRQGPGLPPLLVLQARVGARAVQEGEQGHPELLRQAEQAQGLAEPLRVGLAVVALDGLLGVVPPLVADDHHHLPVEAGRAPDDRFVVPEGAVAVQLDEVGEDGLGVVQGLRAALVARHLHLLPPVELGVDLGGLLLQLAGEGLPAGPQLVRGVGGDFPVQPFQLLPQAGQGTLELQVDAH